MNRTNMIEYLIHLRFPDFHGILERVATSEIGVAAEQELRREVDAYRQELEALSDEDLEMTVQVEEAAEQLLQRRAKAEQEESARFFHQPGADADLAAWADMASWTPDQAAALLLGKEPTIVTWERVEPLVEYFPFARRFGHLRAQLGADLRFPARPAAVMAWAEPRGLAVPELFIVARECTGSAQTAVPRPRDHKLAAAMEAMVEIWGSEEPKGVTSYGLAALCDHLKERGKPSISESTAKRAWTKLYRRVGQDHDGS
jgi:hypothetical protein